MPKAPASPWTRKHRHEQRHLNSRGRHGYRLLRMAHADVAWSDKVQRIHEDAETMTQDELRKEIRRYFVAKLELLD
jgi:hypothetical protein